MAKRSNTIGKIGVVVIAAIIGLAFVVQLGLQDAKTDPYADDLARQNRTGEGGNVDGVVGLKDGTVRMPTQADDVIVGSTDANDLTTIADPDTAPAEVATQGSRRLEPDAVISPETGEVQNDTGLVRVETAQGEEKRTASDSSTDTGKTQEMN